MEVRAWIAVFVAVRAIEECLSETIAVAAVILGTVEQKRFGVKTSRRQTLSLDSGRVSPGVAVVVDLVLNRISLKIL